MQGFIKSMAAAVNKSGARRSPSQKPRCADLSTENLEERIAPSILETTYTNLPYDTSNPDWASNVVNGRTIDSVGAFIQPTTSEKMWRGFRRFGHLANRGR
jgi:hypothetical protein